MQLYIELIQHKLKTYKFRTLIIFIPVMYFRLFFYFVIITWIFFFIFSLVPRLNSGNTERTHRGVFSEDIRHHTVRWCLENPITYIFVRCSKKLFFPINLPFALLFNKTFGKFLQHSENLLVLYGFSQCRAPNISLQQGFLIFTPITRDINIFLSLWNVHTAWFLLLVISLVL